mmetsp:Transcript_19680/g.58525  ORF Transcript_19680/g.58525 Transcript_19680/m.58525 type:complete len:249 (+) Transcript_19680:96-842(+)
MQWCRAHVSAHRTARERDDEIRELARGRGVAQVARVRRVREHYELRVVAIAPVRRGGYGEARPPVRVEPRLVLRTINAEHRDRRGLGVMSRPQGRRCYVAGDLVGPRIHNEGEGVRAAHRSGNNHQRRRQVQGLGDAAHEASSSLPAADRLRRRAVSWQVQSYPPHTGLRQRIQDADVLPRRHRERRAVAEKDRFGGVLRTSLQKLDGLAVDRNRAVVDLVLVDVGVADGALEVRVRRAAARHPPRRD